MKTQKTPTTHTARAREEYSVVFAAAMKAPLVSSVSVPLAIKMSVPCEHPVRGRMALSVRVEETVCVAGASVTPQRVAAVIMVSSASVTMNTVRSSRINYVEEMVSATVAIVNAILASRAQPVSVRCLQKAVLPPTTLYAMEEGNASVTAVSVTRVTSIHDARHALAALTLARPN